MSTNNGFFIFHIFLHHLSCCFYMKRAFSLRKRKRTKECVACSILAAGPGLLSAAHTSISLFAWAFGIVNYIWIFFLDDKHVVLLSTKACFQGRALPSGLCVNAVKLTLHTEHFRNPSACISCIRLPTVSSSISHVALNKHWQLPAGCVKTKGKLTGCGIKWIIFFKANWKCLLLEAANMNEKDLKSERCSCCARLEKKHFCQPYYP